MTCQIGGRVPGVEKVPSALLQETEPITGLLADKDDVQILRTGRATPFSAAGAILRT